jgi:hypothetical protein
MGEILTMAVTNYYTVDGSLVAEETGGSRLDNHLDALGSIAAQTDSNQSVTAAGRYAAYGSTYWSSGALSSVKFSWCGSWGYRKTQTSTDSLRHAENYVMARHYSATDGRWTTVDPLWPSESAYLYGWPTMSVDPSGLSGYRAVCHCKPKPHVHGYPQVIDRKTAECIEAACVQYCQNGGDVDPAYYAYNTLKGGPLDQTTYLLANMFIEALPPCTAADGIIWKECGEQLCNNGTYSNGEPANASNYPKPARQYYFQGRNYCNIEARMRLCCYLNRVKHQCQEILAKRWANCYARWLKRGSITWTPQEAIPRGRAQNRG